MRIHGLRLREPARILVHTIYRSFDSVRPRERSRRLRTRWAHTPLQAGSCSIPSRPAGREPARMTSGYASRGRAASYQRHRPSRLCTARGLDRMPSPCDARSRKHRRSRNVTLWRASSRTSQDRGVLVLWIRPARRQDGDRRTSRTLVLLLRPSLAGAPASGSATRRRRSAVQRRGLEALFFVGCYRR